VVNALVGRKAIVTKLGMDAHWRGAIVVANALRDAGMEVVYLGHALPQEIVSAVLQEDAILLGLSSLSGNHLTECPPVLAGLREAGLEDVAVVLGGAIPPQDEPALRKAGIAAVFGTGASLKVIIVRIAELVAAAELKRQRHYA
jgi:methylmalonyl-CoA mutase C-terminal domain/subunit